MKRILSAAFVALLVLSACGRDEPGDPGATPTPVATPTPTGPPDAELPGERIDLFPHEGDELAVVGVAADDTLNVRVGPGAGFQVVFELEPLATGITATGHNRSLGDDGIWSEIRAGDRTGWANSVFLLQPGRVSDVTADLYPAPPDRPRAETMLELGQMVAAEIAVDEPPSRVVVVDGPSVGDLGEITVDVIGLADTSVGGQRLKVFGQPDEGGESFTVRTVEATLLCLRGVVEDGLCI